MTQLNRVAFIGNSLPRRCGIATFTTDLQQAIAESDLTSDTCIVAMTDHGHTYNYPTTVRLEVADDRIEDYVRAADALNAGQFDVVSLQHEFGIFGGEAGGHIMALLSRLTMPVVTTLHTVLAQPTPPQRSVLNRIVGASNPYRTSQGGLGTRHVPECLAPIGAASVRYRAIRSVTTWCRFTHL